jgi:hypothetical protein
MVRDMEMDMNTDMGTDTRHGQMDMDIGFTLKYVLSVTHQLRWRTEASGWAPSAACSHHPIACVEHSRGLYRHLDFIWWTKTSFVFSDSDGTIIRTSTLRVRGQNSIVWRTSIATSGQASTAGTIIGLSWVYMANHVEETMDKRTTWGPQKF